MCSSIAEGGKRCAVHMHGSRAAVKEAEIYTQEDRGVLSRMFTKLRREGKNLPAPEPEEVQAYADGQRVRARFDSSLSKRDSNTLIRNWTKARDEEPDGGTFHAWKNLRSSAAAQKLRRGVAVLSIGTAVVATGACGAQPKQEEAPTPTTTPTAEQTTEAPAPTPEGFTYELPSGFTTGQPAQSIHGEYLPLSLEENSPLLNYSDSVATPEVVSNFDPEDVQEAQQIASTFVVEQGVDSVLVYDYSEENAEAWWNENKDVFHPDYQNDFHSLVTDGSKRNPLVDNNGGDALGPNGERLEGGHWSRGNPVYETGTVRTGNVSIELVEISSDSNGSYLGFEYDASVSRIIEDPSDLSKGPLVETTDSDFTIYMLPHNGSWRIAGTNNNFSTQAQVQ